MRDFFYCQYKHDGPLRLRYHMGPDGCLALVDTYQVAALLSQEREALFSWLSREEKQYLQRFRFPKRHNEWLSGRIAAKCSLLQGANHNHFPIRPCDFSILPDTHGRPILSPALTGNDWRISISHSHQYAVAMTADQACGVDIQNIGPQILNVQDRIATTDEIALAHQILPENVETSLTLLWTVKEALKKHRLPDQPGMFQAVSLEQIRPTDERRSWIAECRLTRDNQRQAVHVIHLDQYMLAWCQG